MCIRWSIVVFSLDIPTSHQFNANRPRPVSFTHIDVFLQIESERTETEVRFDSFHRRLKTDSWIDFILDDDDDDQNGSRERMTSYWDISEGGAWKRERKFDVRWKEKERITDVVAIASIETGILQEIHTATDDITGGESRSIGNAGSRRAKWMSIISMIPIGSFIPARQSIETDFFRRQANTHVPKYDAPNSSLDALVTSRTHLGLCWWFSLRNSRYPWESEWDDQIEHWLHLYVIFLVLVEEDCWEQRSIDETLPL